MAALADLTRSLAKPGNPGFEPGAVGRLSSVPCAGWLRAEEALDAELVLAAGPRRLFTACLRASRRGSPSGGRRKGFSLHAEVHGGSYFRFVPSKHEDHTQSKSQIHGGLRC